MIQGLDGRPQFIRKRNAGQVDVALEADVDQRVGFALAGTEAHHLAHAALRVMTLTLGKTIVNQEGSTLLDLGRLLRPNSGSSRD